MGKKTICLSKLPKHLTKHLMCAVTLVIQRPGTELQQGHHAGGQTAHTLHSTWRVCHTSTRTRLQQEGKEMSSRS